VAHGREQERARPARAVQRVHKDGRARRGQAQRQREHVRLALGRAVAPAQAVAGARRRVLVGGARGGARLRERRLQAERLHVGPRRVGGARVQRKVARGAAGVAERAAERAATRVAERAAEEACRCRCRD
jgi:hypothetical protein